jgi:hypothetical protein
VAVVVAARIVAAPQLGPNLATWEHDRMHVHVGDLATDRPEELSQFTGSNALRGGTDDIARRNRAANHPRPWAWAGLRAWWRIDGRGRTRITTEPDTDAAVDITLTEMDVSLGDITLQVGVGQLVLDRSVVVATPSPRLSSSPLSQAADAVRPMSAPVPLGSTVPSKKDGTRMHRRSGLSASRLTSMDQKRRALFGDLIRALIPRAAESFTKASPAFDMTHARDRFVSSDRSSGGGLCSHLPAGLCFRHRRSPAARFNTSTLRNNLIASGQQQAGCRWLQQQAWRVGLCT